MIHNPQRPKVNTCRNGLREQVSVRSPLLSLSPLLTPTYCPCTLAPMCTPKGLQIFRTVLFISDAYHSYAGRIVDLIAHCAHAAIWMQWCCVIGAVWERNQLKSHLHHEHKCERACGVWGVESRMDAPECSLGVPISIISSAVRSRRHTPGGGIPYTHSQCLSR